jgi:hypothetical protein
MILWVGAGLVALIGLETASLTGGSPRWLTALVVTLIVVSGGALAWGRIKFEWAATKLDRAVDDQTVEATDQLRAEDAEWPAVGEVAWLVGLLCVPVAGVLYLISVWWAVP